MHVRSKTYMPKSESRWNKKWTTFLGAEPVITRIKSDNKIISSDWLKTPSKGSLAVDKVLFIGRQGYGVPLHDLHVLNSTTLNWPRVVQNKPLILKIGQNWLDYGLIIGWGENKVLFMNHDKIALITLIQSGRVTFWHFQAIRAKSYSQSESEFIKKLEF